MTNASCDPQSPGQHRVTRRCESYRLRGNRYRVLHRTTCDTSGIWEQIKDAINKAGTSAAKPAGEKISKDIFEGII